MFHILSACHSQYCIIIIIYHIFFYHGIIVGFKGFGYNQLRYYGDIMIPLWTAQAGSLLGTKMRNQNWFLGLQPINIEKRTELPASELR